MTGQNVRVHLRPPYTTGLAKSEKNIHLSHGIGQACSIFSQIHVWSYVDAHSSYSGHVSAELLQQFQLESRFLWGAVAGWFGHLKPRGQRTRGESAL